MKILGLFAVVFGCLLINKLLGFSDMASIVGTIVGSGSYILLQINGKG
jgi:phosphate/sulfate permease